MATPSFPSSICGANEPPRTVDPFERALFDSTRADEVPAQARERVALALGISVPAGNAAARPPHDASGGKPGAARAGGAKLALASKAALVGLTGGLAALLLLAHPSDVPATARSAVLPPSVSEPQPVHEAPTPPAAALLSERSAPLPEGPAANTTSLSAHSPRLPPRSGHGRAHLSSSGGARGAAAPAQSRLLAEVARLDEARNALAAGDRRVALKHLERYSSEFPDGVLAREAARLQERARALDSGSSARARDIGQAR
jgi:hypothetical protein